MTAAVVAEWQKWLQRRGPYASEQEGDEENDTSSINTSRPSSSNSNPNYIISNLSNRFNSWGFTSLQGMLMGLNKCKPSRRGLHTGLALLALYQIAALLSGPDVEIGQSLQDLAFVRSPNFSCSELRLKGEKLVVDGQHYHTFPSDVNPRSICQSKFQQHCYRKRTQFPPPKFLSLLREYEAYHEKCTEGHNLTALGVRGDTPEGCKYLVWKSADGMGNQLLSLVCSFVYSLLTNRVMLIATDSHIDSHICNPFPLSSWVLPKDFPERQLRKGAKRVHTYLDETLASAQGGNMTSPLDLISQAPKHLHAFIMCCDAKRDHQFFCPTAQKLFLGSNWIFYCSHEYTLPGFYFIPEFREKLNDWFPRRDVFMHAARYLLNPENELWAQISQFYRAHMDGVHKQIGIQPRAWLWKYNPVISRQMLRCAVEQHLLPKTLQSQKTPNETRRPDISVLVTSLRGREYRDNLALEYMTHPNAEGLDVDVISASSEGFQQTRNATHDATAVIDIWLLSFVHDLVTTPFSTFGSTASGLAGIVPLLFNNYGQDKVLEPACGRTNAGGPCFTTYPSNQTCDLDPPQFSIFDPDKMVPEVRYCNFAPGLGIVTT